MQDASRKTIGAVNTTDWKPVGRNAGKTVARSGDSMSDFAASTLDTVVAMPEAAGTTLPWAAVAGGIVDEMTEAGGRKDLAKCETDTAGLCDVAAVAALAAAAALVAAAATLLVTEV